MRCFSQHILKGINWSELYSLISTKKLKILILRICVHIHYFNVWTFFTCEFCDGCVLNFLDRQGFYRHLVQYRWFPLPWWVFSLVISFSKTLFTAVPTSPGRCCVWFVLHWSSGRLLIEEHVPLYEMLEGIGKYDTDIFMFKWVKK